MTEKLDLIITMAYNARTVNGVLDIEQARGLALGLIKSDEDTLDHILYSIAEDDAAEAIKEDQAVMECLLIPIIDELLLERKPRRIKKPSNWDDVRLQALARGFPVGNA